MGSGPAQLPHLARLALVATVIPILVGLAILASAWPTARTEPRNLPVGIVGTTPGNELLVEHLSASGPGAFQFRVYPDLSSARDAIEQRDIYGAFSASTESVQLWEATAASPSVAQALESAAGAAAGQAVSPSGIAGSGDPSVSIEDVVPLSPADPRGLVFGSCILPLTICSILAAAAVALLVRLRPAWRQILALCTTAVLAGGVVYLIGQTYLGALPHHGWADWAVLALTVFAISSSTAGLIALIGAPGLGLGAALMIFVANPFSAVTSAPELLPDPVAHIGQLLPPGAGANALRSTAYFAGGGTGEPLVVLIAWALFGIAAIVVGHHAPIRLASGPRVPVVTTSPIQPRPRARRGME